MKKLTRRNEIDIADFCRETGLHIAYLEAYLDGQLTWTEFWDKNIHRVNLHELACGCRFVEISKRPGPTTMADMQSAGVALNKLHPTYMDEQTGDYIYLCCRCDQEWREVEVESGQYWARHLYPTES